MLLLKYVLISGGVGMLIAAALVLLSNARNVWIFARSGQPADPLPLAGLRWKPAARIAALACVPLLIGSSFVIVPSGKAGVRVSQISGTLTGTLYPGLHFIAPLIHRVELFSIRDHVFKTMPAEAPKLAEPVLKVYSKEGLPVGLGVSVRYQLDPQRLPHIQSHLPAAIETEILPPIVANAFRQTVSAYMVRDVFSTRREEVRRVAADAIARQLGSDGIVVKEVMLHDIGLPPEFAKGLEGLLLKAQENDRLTIDLEVKQKQVRTAELEAEAEKARQVKHAEGRAQITVLEAKAQADAMQHTLPLKEKQIQQSRLEAEARKEATVKNAEAAAQAKVIDSKAELEKRNLMADADQHKIKVLAVADAERMRSEAQVLKDNPLLIQKIIAERLSDKVQIMMVPMDGKFFFTNDVLRTLPASAIPRENERP